MPDCLVLLLAASALLAEAINNPASSPAYRLRLYHLHTGEHIDVAYRIGDTYLPDGVAALDRFLRDHRTGEEKDYDVKEFDLLHDLMVRLGRPDGEIDIVCGYRTPWSNTYLRNHGHGVALHSQHMEAKAIDMRVPGATTNQVRDAAISMQHDIAHLWTGATGMTEAMNFTYQTPASYRVRP